ncbi:Hypothetical predicted protein [Paramuricea clavata]|uniref:Uncharacterized protein n=1 Tax=Paramuricea clavata TaxID=317549 RepID=A0A6S7I5V4_PARCT|nr:Hypothetical predicted protein [Paramuricea clavata]
MEECIRVCCMQKFCDLAFVINGTCFTVRCHTEEGCQEVRSPGSGFKPMISYVVREKPRNYHKKHEKVHGKNLGKKHHQKGDLKNSKNTTTSEMPHVPPPSLPSVDSEHYCTNSEIMYNVTLRGGITSGTFRDRGVLPNMQECLRICCIAKSCDLAFMLSNRCFSVTCKKQTLCEVVTARSSGYKPQIAYIYARSNIANHDPSSEIRSQDQSLTSLPVDERDHPNQKPNKIINNHTQDSSHKHKKKKNLNVKQISPSKHKKKPYKTKKPRRRKKHKGKIHQSNRAKLKRLYAKERILLRKLSLLKLRMEMIKRKDHDGDKSTKDNVLLEAFEDEPKIPKTTLNKDKDSRPQIRNKTKRTDENTSIISTKLVMESNTTRGATDKSKKQSNRSKPFIRKDANISMNGNTFTTKEKQLLYEKDVENYVSTENEKLFESNTFTEERNFLPNETGNTSNIFPSFPRNESSNRPKHSTKQLVKETGKVKTSNLTNFGLSKFQNVPFRDMVSQTEDNSQTNSNEKGDIEEREKQTKTNIEKGKTSFERMKEFYSGKKDRKDNTASLEEMISQTTESKNREFEKVLPKNRDRRKNRTFGTKKFKGYNTNGNSNSQKDSAKIFENIVPNISVSSAQSEDHIETRTSEKNVSVANDLIPKSLDSFIYPQKTRNDLMLLGAFPFKTIENDGYKRTAKPMENHFIVANNSSKTLSSRKKGDNS